MINEWESNFSNTINGMTLGEVVDTNDPQQMGRLRIVCPFWGDPIDPTPEQIDQLPWAMYLSPFGGSTETITRGDGATETTGQVSYGMWGIPKKGAQVLVATVDGDSMHRVYMGSVFKPHMPHTLPHGRNIEGVGAPLSSSEQPIEPLASNINKSFGDASKYEWHSRGVDYSVAAVDRVVIDSNQQLTPSLRSDTKDATQTLADGKSRNLRQGYAADRATKTEQLSNRYTNGQSYDSQVYSWTSPGFHAISMDDRPENSRIRVRTTAGHQIIMDDTNERIYISTFEGNNWIEMDRNGNIDLYSERNVSVHAKKDINFQAGEHIRLQAKDSIHLRADNEIRFHSINDTHMKNDNLRNNSATNINLTAGADYNGNFANGYVSADTYNFTTTDFSVVSTSIGFDGTFDVNGATQIKGATVIDGPTINLNAPSIVTSFITGIAAHATTAITAQMAHTATLAAHAGTGGGPGAAPTPGTVVPPVPAPSSASVSVSTTAASTAGEKEAFLTSRLPDHEPWARVMMTDAADQDSGNTHVEEFAYDSPEVGTVERGESIPRNSNWRR
jgi:hypothetical protein